MNPKFINYVETDGAGVHRPVYDKNRKLLYSSSNKDGFDKWVLLIHDMKDPWAPELIGTAWVPGQREGEEITWDLPWAPDAVGHGCQIHEGNPFGNYVTAGCWDAGVALFDLADPAKPEFMWRHSPHETHGWSGGYHTFLVPPGSEFAIATHETVTVNCEYPPAFVSFYDMRNINEPLLASTFQPYPIDPLTMRPLDNSWCETGSRYGAHNVWLDMEKDDLMYICWFNAGLRIVDWSNPFEPKEVGYYIPAGNKERFCPQSNDVFVDKKTGLIYMSDRWGLGLHILEYTG
ncbi:MAG: hypothetical protein HOG04_04680 [Nitrospinaceae bacterium]|nr:hypothetical protein [Nitrospinaceae bacterium]